MVTYRRTREFDHYSGCNFRDPANCSACALTDQRQEQPNYAAWPLVYMENGRSVPAKWRKAFVEEFDRKDNLAYVANLHATLAKYGVRFVNQPARTHTRLETIQAESAP